MPDIIHSQEVTYWNARGARGAEQRKASLANLPEEKCQGCGLTFHPAHIERHQRGCKGPKVVLERTYAGSVHDACPTIKPDGTQCGRKKTRSAHRCFRCSGVDLDAIVMAGRPKE